jgi:hypothetical protein
MLAGILTGRHVAHGADSKQAADLVAQLCSADSDEQAAAKKKLRELGSAAIAALREAKPEKDEALARVRLLLTEIALDAACTDPADAALLHQLAREEGDAKRYANTERLYAKADKLYEKLKDDAASRGDRVKEREYKEKEQICNRMKDKAARKLKGDSHSGLNLGFMRIGGEHDMSDEWE